MWKIAIPCILFAFNDELVSTIAVMILFGMFAAKLLKERFGNESDV